MAKALTEQEKKELLERFVKEKKGFFYSTSDAAEGLTKFTGLKSASNWIRPLFSQSPTEFYVSNGLILSEELLPQRCENVVAELIRLHHGKPAINGLSKLQEEYPDIPLKCLGILKQFDFFQLVHAGILTHPYPTKADREKAIENCMKAIRNGLNEETFIYHLTIRDDDKKKYISITDIKLSMYKVSHVPNDPDDPQKGETVWYGMEDEVIKWIEEYQGMPIREYFLQEGILCSNYKEIAAKMLKGAERYHAKNGPERGWSDPIKYVHAEGASEKVKRGEWILDDSSITYFDGTNLFHYYVDEGIEMGLSAKEAEARARQFFIDRGLIEGTKSEPDKKIPDQSKANVKVYKLPDDTITKLLIGDKDSLDAIEKRKFPKKTVLTVGTEHGSVTVTNQAYTDIRRCYRELSSCEPYYDQYVAAEHYLNKEQMAERVLIADGGHSDAACFAEPGIDWIAPELTQHQIAVRFLLLAEAADKLLTEDGIKEIVAAMPKTKKGEIAKNRVTRIASGNIVTAKAMVLELVAKAKTEKNVIICAEYRRFSREELETIENDYLSTHFSVFGWDTLPESSKKELKSIFENVTVYRPEDLSLKPADRGSVTSDRYKGIELQFDSVWELVQAGFSYEKAAYEAEKLSLKNSSTFLWAPLKGNPWFPMERPHDDDTVQLHELVISGYQTSSKLSNRFLFAVDRACVRDAIRKHDVTLLKDRARFLSPENIGENISFATEENAGDCAAWLEEQKQNQIKKP